MDRYGLPLLGKVGPVSAPPKQVLPRFSKANHRPPVPKCSDLRVSHCAERARLLRTPGAFWVAEVEGEGSRLWGRGQLFLKRIVL